MNAIAISTQRLDRFGMGLSGLCLVHCVMTTVLVATLASAGSLLGSPLIHEIGLGFAMLIGLYALWRGVSEHGFMMPAAIGAFGLGMMAGALTMPHNGNEALATMMGVGMLAFGHRLNEIARN